MTVMSVESDSFTQRVTAQTVLSQIVMYVVLQPFVLIVRKTLLSGLTQNPALANQL